MGLCANTCINGSDAERDEVRVCACASVCMFVCMRGSHIISRLQRRFSMVASVVHSKIVHDCSGGGLFQPKGAHCMRKRLGVLAAGLGRLGQRWRLRRLWNWRCCCFCWFR